MKKDLEKVDISKLNEKLVNLPYIFSDVLAMYYGLDDMGRTSLEEIVDVIKDTFNIVLTPEVVEHIIEEALEMVDYQGDLNIYDSERVITIDSPDSKDIRINLDMQLEYGCRAVYAVTVDAEDKMDLSAGVKRLTLVALNEQGLRKIDSIMQTGYNNADGIYVRDYAQILADRKDSYLIGQEVNWQYFLNRSYLLSEDELKFEISIRDRFKDADFAIFPRLRYLYYSTNPDVLTYNDETLAYTASDFQKAREAAAVAAIILEKRNIIPTAGLDSLLSIQSDILDYIYFEDEAKRAVIINPASIADKADYPNPQKDVNKQK